MVNLAEAFQGYLGKITLEKEIIISDFVRFAEDLFFKTGFRTKKNDKQIFEILIVRDDEIGDVIMTSGFLREVRRIYPQAQITLVVKPALFALVERCPYVNEIIVYNWGRGRAKGFGGLYLEMMSLCKEKLWDKKIDLFFCPRWEFDWNFPTLLGYMSGAKERVGYSETSQIGKKREDSWDLLLTKSITVPLQQCHDVIRIFFILEALGYVVTNKSLEVWFDAKDNAIADMLLAEMNIEEADEVIAVVPGAGHRRRRWNPDCYAALLKQIILREPNTKIIILGAADERELGELIRTSLPEGVALNLAGRTSLRQSSAILSKCQLYIGSDTGLMHMAAASQVPVLSPNCCAKNITRTLYTVPERVEPWQVESVTIYPETPLEPCGTIGTGHGCVAEVAHCINQVTVAEMFKGWQLLRECSKKQSLCENVQDDMVVRIAGLLFMNEKKTEPRGLMNCLGELFPILDGASIGDSALLTLNDVIVVMRKHNKEIVLKSMAEARKLCSSVRFHVISSLADRTLIKEKLGSDFLYELWGGLDEQERFDRNLLGNSFREISKNSKFATLLFADNYYDYLDQADIELFYKLGVRQMLVVDSCLVVRHVSALESWLSAWRLLRQWIEWYWNVTTRQEKIAPIFFRDYKLLSQLSHLKIEN